MRRMMWVHPLNELRLDKGEFYTLCRAIKMNVLKLFQKYTVVLKGLGNATDLNVLQGKAYEKPC